MLIPHFASFMSGGFTTMAVVNQIIIPKGQKITKAIYGSLILLKNEQKIEKNDLTFRSNYFHSFLRRIEDTIIFFWDFLTFTLLLTLILEKSEHYDSFANDMDCFKITAPNQFSDRSTGPESQNKQSLHKLEYLLTWVMSWVISTTRWGCWGRWLKG